MSKKRISILLNLTPLLYERYNSGEEGEINALSTKLGFTSDNMFGNG